MHGRTAPPRIPTTRIRRAGAGGGRRCLTVFSHRSSCRPAAADATRMKNDLFPPCDRPWPVMDIVRSHPGDAKVGTDVTHPSQQGLSTCLSDQRRDDFDGIGQGVTDW